MLQWRRAGSRAAAHDIAALSIFVPSWLHWFTVVKSDCKFEKKHTES